VKTAGGIKRTTLKKLGRLVAAHEPKLLIVFPKGTTEQIKIKSVTKVG
jgi:hypothetical protein